ncbi:hypothetical protein FF1_005325 [Malus domestica]
MDSSGEKVKAKLGWRKLGNTIRSPRQTNNDWNLYVQPRWRAAESLLQPSSDGAKAFSSTTAATAAAASG